ncbi:MAG: hypothetical protein Q9Q40_01375, partial [Acidobacteriota bacterium]|nr:hypothetical protein [Acidobacteriota bacterium]
ADATYGLSRSRVFYYPSHLAQPEMAALDQLSSRRLLHEFYPNLPHQTEALPWMARVKGGFLVGLGPLKHLRQQFQRYGKSPAWFIRRTWRRLRP